MTRTVRLSPFSSKNHCQWLLADVFEAASCAASHVGLGQAQRHPDTEEQRHQQPEPQPKEERAIALLEGASVLIELRLGFGLAVPHQMQCVAPSAFRKPPSRM